MTRLLLLLAFLGATAGCRRGVDGTTAQLFLQGNERLAQAQTADDCRAAAARFEAALESGGENGVVLQALGNAYGRAGEKGEAIAAWRRAQLHRPRDPLLAANLAQMRQGLPHEPTALIDELFFWRVSTSYGEQAAALLIAVLLACAAATAATFSPRHRGALRPFVGGATLLALLAAAGFARTVQVADLVRHGVVTRDEVVARKGDGDNFEAAFTAPLGDGTECRILEERGDWRLIELPGGLRGWLRADCLASR